MRTYICLFALLALVYAEPPVNGLSPPSSSYGVPSNSYGPPRNGNGHGNGNGNGHGNGNGNGNGKPKPVYGVPDEGAEAPASYHFEYAVKDEESGNDFGHEESREGDVATGKYYVLLPDGRKQIVEYTADNDGYKPKITYEEAENGGYPSGPANGGYPSGPANGNGHNGNGHNGNGRNGNGNGNGHHNGNGNGGYQY